MSIFKILNLSSAHQGGRLSVKEWLYFSFGAGDGQTADSEKARYSSVPPSSHLARITFIWEEMIWFSHVVGPANVLIRELARMTNTSCQHPFQEDCVEGTHIFNLRH